MIKKTTPPQFRTPRSPVITDLEVEKNRQVIRGQLPKILHGSMRGKGGAYTFPFSVLVNKETGQILRLEKGLIRNFDLKLVCLSGSYTTGSKIQLVINLSEQLSPLAQQRVWDTQDKF